MPTFKNTVEFNKQQEAIYGRLHCISSKAASEAGLVEACIMGHLHFLQGYNPKGGHIPETEDGDRASFNSYLQIHRRLPFISISTIKATIKRLMKKYPGFTKFKYPGQAVNHYHIDAELVEQLDLEGKGRKLWFHELEAQHFGILKAILLQRITYCNATFAITRRDPQFCEPDIEYRRYSRNKRNVTRALASLYGLRDSLGQRLLTHSVEAGFLVDPFQRQMWLEHFRSAPRNSAKATLPNCQTHIEDLPMLNQVLPNPHMPTSFLDTQSVESVTLTSSSLLLNRSNQVLSTIVNEIAAQQPNTTVPSALTEANLIDGEWIEFDCRTPLSVSPVMVDQCRVSAEINCCDKDAQRVTCETSAATESESSSADLSDAGKASSCDSSAASVPLVVKKKTFGFLPLETNPARTEWECLKRFEGFVKDSGLVTMTDVRTPFLNEFRANPELGPNELEIVYRRLIDSIVHNYHVVYDGKFNPYFHSCMISTPGQFVSKFYLILEDHFKVSREEKFRRQCDQNELRADTPEHVRRYIERKRKASTWTKD